MPRESRLLPSTSISPVIRRSALPTTRTTPRPIQLPPPAQPATRIVSRSPSKCNNCKFLTEPARIRLSIVGRIAMKNAIRVFALGSLLLAAASAQSVTSHNRHNLNLNINTHGDSTSCADLKATSNGEISQTAERFDLSRAEAPTLELN